MREGRLEAGVGALACLLLAGCPHEGDATAGSPAGPAPSANAAAEADGPTESPPPSEAPDAALAVADAGSPEASSVTVSPPDMSAAPTYPASSLYETFSSPSARQKLIACYTPGKQRDSKLRGKVIVKFTINQNGSAKPVANEGSNLQDDAVIACVVRAVKTLRFPKPLEGTVTVVYPFIFRPTGDETLILPDIGKK